MHIVQKYRVQIAAIVVIILGILIAFVTYDHFRPVPDNSSFKTRYFTFMYPRTYDAEEYASGVVSVGHKNGDGLDPLIEIVRYQSDPDTATPTTFDAFVKRQAAALCGADGSVESVTCTQIGVTPYQSTSGFAGEQLNLTLVRKNLKTGTTTSSTYGPMYVFNTTASSTPDSPLRYQAIFVYPSLAAFLSGTTTPELTSQILSTFILNKKVSTVGQ